MHEGKMEFENLNKIGLAYLIFAFLSSFLVDIGKISTFPILICVTSLLLYFLGIAIIKLGKTKIWDWVDFTFLLGIPILISLQVTSFTRRDF